MSGRIYLAFAQQSPCQVPVMGRDRLALDIQFNWPAHGYSTGLDFSLDIYGIHWISCQAQLKTGIASINRGLPGVSYISLYKLYARVMLDAYTNL